ncbi:MAG: PTS transporter subunit EIIC [Miniphocaeibacter sp.]|uniref:PTS transporter subunit EIIC n=1 Tax=Miniphocaeibacter sp. TaxID=3100973 RepID=UPI00181474CC|nr:PTS transporter subunit EIIC [Gallicola sp.]
MFKNLFKKFQQLGKAFMLPIAILPAAGLLLGIGGALSNPNTIMAFPVLDNRILQVIFKVMSEAGNVVFANIALIFAIGIALGLAKKDKGTAALAGGVAFLVFNATIAALVGIFLEEGSAIDTGVVGSIVIGSIVAYLHNNYRDVELPQFLGFFGGSRFIPIVSSFAAILLGVAFFLIWPPIQNLLVLAGGSIAKMGSVGTFLYGFLLRLTGAVGLHHVIYPMFWYTALGGAEMVAGQMVEGAQNIFFAQLADPNHQGLFTYGTRFFAGRFDTMMFGLPAACLAMYHCVPKENRKKVVGLYFSAALTSFLTGITEPIEFMFLFIAPWLYVIHALFDGLSFLIADLLSIRIGNTFSGGAIDFTLFGILQGNDKTNWIYVIIVGVLWALMYYFLFRFLINKFDVKIPGRAIDNGEEVKVTTKESLADEALLIMEALGGAENLENVDACITRLRVDVVDPSKVDKDRLVELGATAVLEVQGGVQAVYGAKADKYKNAINKVLGYDE